ncbi:MAG: hypothetical protein CMB25_08210 [Euryarchaeota archaeon]|nr:hypothetical protein [Euryarchaeota archaeon]
MALVVADRLQETTTTTGTGTYTLAGAKSGFSSFSSIGDGNTTYYACSDGTDFEVGIGTYTASGTTLARTTILTSSNSNNAVNWGAGEKDIFVTLPSAKTVLEDASNNVTTGGTINGRNLSTDGSKLDGIEASATADQTAAEIRTLVESATDSNVFTDADHTKLNGIETSATADQTDAEIKTAYENNADTNAFTDALQTKLNGIETSATADQTDAEIKTAYENNSDTNAFTDALQTKLNGVAASANAYVHPNHSGEVTSTADGATVIADDVVDEANLKVSNTPTDGYFLSAQSGNTGGLTWASPPAGYADSDVDTHLNQSSASSGQYLQWNGSDYAWAAVSSVGGATGVDFNDNVKARFGTGNDLEIYHDGTDAYIASAASNIKYGGSGAGANVNHIFYSNGYQRCQVDRYGVDVTGNMYASGSGSFGSSSSGGYRLYVNGDSRFTSSMQCDYNITSNNTMYCNQINVAGTTYYGGGYYLSYSDDILKQRIANIPEALSKISQLNGFHYTDSDTVTDLIRGTNPDGTVNLVEKETAQKVGVSAQELEKVLPEAVGKTLSKQSATETEYLTVDYQRIVPLLIEGIKELKTKVETLETENTAIKARLDALEA